MKKLLPLALLVLLQACVFKSPHTGAVPTGEKLWTKDDTYQTQHAVKEKVAEVEHKDDRGTVVGKSDVYENRTVTQTHKIWLTMQGENAIDEQDFFRIAGNEAIVERIQKRRESGRSLVVIGEGVMVGGFAAVIGSYFLAPTSGLRTALLWGGLLGTSGGCMTFYWGHARLNALHHVDRSEAIESADRYNKGLGAQSEASGREVVVSYEGKF